MDVKKTHVGLEHIKSMCVAIHRQTQQDNFNPELLVGLSRGGLIPLALLAGEGMFNNRNVKTIPIASYDDVNNQKELKLLASVDTEDYKSFASILIVDDIADTGETLLYILELLKRDISPITIKVATLFYKKKSKLIPDYYVEETSDWIVFPWEE